MSLAARDNINQQPSDWTGTGRGRVPARAEHASSLAAELAEEHTLLAGIAANMRSGFLLLNQAEHIAYANPSAWRLLRVESASLYPPDVFDIRQQLVSLAVNPASAQLELERLWRHPDEEGSTDLALADAAVRWLRVQSFPIHSAPGQRLGRGLLLDDITLERSADQTRGETLAMAAHELKTPLAIIKGSATTLLSNSMRWDAAMQREMLQMIDTQTDRLHEILNTLLEVWRLDAGAQNLRLSEVRLPELLSSLVERWRKNAPRHRILCDIATDLPPLLCDPARLEQALQHVLHNAVTYSPGGSTIRVTLQPDEDELRLSVSDEGRGIGAEHIDHIFERFYRVAEGDERAQGSGLGLAVARATIEAHGGRIWADSPGPNEGATFYCVLPLTPPDSLSSSQNWSLTAQLPAITMPATPTTPAPVRRGKRMRVAVVESDPRTARYLRANLEEERYQVQVIHQGRQFLHQFDLEEPELVLLASELNDMQGLELLQRLREFSRVPVVMLCDDEDDEETRVRLLDLGADDLVNKPLNMRELLARLRVLQRRLAALGESEPAESIFRSGELTIDFAQHQVLLQGRPVQLSRTEYKLLSTLAQNAGRVMTHELLLERVWGAEYNREVDFIWVYISRLRRKVEPDSRHPRYILTVPDVGYKLARI
ncbi:MAG TPA: ATP-binding protein [Ktedonobacteraceae bacterium]|nr:ATP-binding protein [Ktedonobacteraceae bacterium]